jgi:hypothetical protein
LQFLFFREPVQVPAGTQAESHIRKTRLFAELQEPVPIVLVGWSGCAVPGFQRASAKTAGRSKKRARTQESY